MYSGPTSDFNFFNVEHFEWLALTLCPKGFRRDKNVIIHSPYVIRPYMYDSFLFIFPVEKKTFWKMYGFVHTMQCFKIHWLCGQNGPNNKKQSKYNGFIILKLWVTVNLNWIGVKKKKKNSRPYAYLSKCFQVNQCFVWFTRQRRMHVTKEIPL